MAMRQGLALASFSNLGTKRCTTPTETRSRAIEIGRAAKVTEDITGEPIGAGHWRSVLVNILDPLTRQHTTSMTGSDSSVQDLKRAILEFTGNVAIDKDVMDIGRETVEKEEEE